jgi:hypothetical protein
MKETIYLVASPYKVERMTKNLPALTRGEIPVRQTRTVDEKAFREPVISKEVYINDWRDGVDMGDVEFQESVITEEEAEMIRQRRLEKNALDPRVSRLHSHGAGDHGVKYVYMSVIGLCIVYIAKHFHWAFGVVVVAGLLVYTLAFLVARLVDEDCR